MPVIKLPKRLGQHFLTDRHLLDAIADAAAIGPEDTVVEVGPGRGSLTRVLAERARRVVALELDPDLAAELAATMPGHVAVFQGDAREADVRALLKGCPPYRLLGNLPYYAATAILRRFLEGCCRPQAATVLVQREVAQQMCATPGGMSLLSVAVQLYGRPRIVRTVRPGSFAPRPRVMSAVVTLDVFPRPAHGVDDPSAFLRIVRAGFRARRKQLRNALAAGLGTTAEEAEALLWRAGIEPTRRAETLSVGEWAELHRCGRDRGDP